MVKVGQQPISFKYLDKLEHGIAYFVLTFSWLLALRKEKYNKVTIITFCCVVFGIIIEILQGTLTTYRQADFYDIIANTVGIMLAVLIFNTFFEKKQAI